MLALVGLMLFVGMVPLAVSTLRAAVDVTALSRILNSMTKRIEITWDSDSSTTYTGCTNYSVSDNGTITFTGTKGSDEDVSEFVIGHGSYREVQISVE